MYSKVRAWDRGLTVTIGCPFENPDSFTAHYSDMEQVTIASGAVL